MLDLVMKGMYGHDVLDQASGDGRRGARHCRHRRRPALLARAWWSRAAPAGFLTKPVKGDELLAAVRNALRGRPLMELTATQQDALIELLNIGFGRAAASLSQLTGHRVVLDVPQVSIHPISAVKNVLKAVVADDVASVHQIFSGPVGGDALLILNHQAAGILKELLTDEPPLPLPLDASAREVLMEVGNILLNACLGTFGNLLNVQVSFSVPRLDLDTLDGVLQSLIVNREGMRYALLVHAGFKLRDAEVTGYLVIVLSVASLDRLLKAVEAWENGH